MSRAGCAKVALDVCRLDRAPALLCSPKMDSRLQVSACRRLPWPRSPDSWPRRTRAKGRRVTDVERTEGRYADFTRRSVMAIAGSADSDEQ